MPDKTDETEKTLTPLKPKRKRLPQSWRKHIRRMKQEARKTGVPYRPE